VNFYFLRTSRNFVEEKINFLVVSRTLCFFVWKMKDTCVFPYKNTCFLILWFLSNLTLHVFLKSLSLFLEISINFIKPPVAFSNNCGKYSTLVSTWQTFIRVNQAQKKNQWKYTKNFRMVYWKHKIWNLLLRYKQLIFI
jgi:hypothetical protein